MSAFEKDNKYYITENVHIICNHGEPASLCEEHLHDFVEIVYIMKGKCVHVIDGIEYPVRHGDLLIINYNQTHSFMKLPDVEYMNICIKPEYINQSLANQENAFALLQLSEFEDFSKILDSNKCKATFSGEERDLIEQTVLLLNSEIEQKSPGYNLAIRSQLNLLLIMMFRKMSLKMNETFSGVSEDLLRYIRENCDKRLTMENMAKRCLYNSAYFSRIFKEHTGMTFTQYLRKVRIEKAIHLIETTDMQISDVIYKVGYSDRTKFFSHFREQIGVSPLKYRKSKN